LDFISINTNGDSIMPELIPNGSLLLASPLLKGSYFEDTVILLVDYSTENGSYGLVLNHLTTMPLNEVFDGYHYSHPPKTYTFNLGGPVQENMLQIIQTNTSILEDTVEMQPRVFIGGEWHSNHDFLEQVLAKPDLRIFLGYTGWAPGQLENEIAEGAWELHHTDIYTLLHGPKEQLQAPVEEFKKRFSLH
jgi:putative transcriptional regulator